jgi:hypothetical protein
LNTYPPAVLKKQVSELLSTDDMAAGSIANEWLRKKISCTQEFCKELKMNVNAEDKGHNVNRKTE